ncbi:MAG: hypothetical protein JJ959_14975 [Nisaea sp.]|uniref:thymidylate synthase n=1 Tax=Nisaea sp. TaxID=2024842 RepID=UPI001B0D854A|nr:thymidylate synthase [Nisaea sp.]MBO6561845.1 hypothetical protein [Nisaea sp.]
MSYADNGFAENSADSGFRSVLKNILSAPSVNAVSTGADKVRYKTFEKLAFQFRIENPLHRIVANNVFTLSLPVAVARFVWMISGNNRLADIAFYEPRVASFTDDGVIVPGSSYGARIRQAHPGIDQLKGVIDRLKADPNSRRAAISIYQPTDTTRESSDIPCAFGLFFHIREEKLHTQIIMRSNNAAVLLPFNIFEFSMLAEVVAAECGVAMAPLSHYAASMHIYENAEEFTNRIVVEGGATRSDPMIPMPNNPKPLDEVLRLVQYEASMRHRSEAIDDSALQDEIDQIQEMFSPYWQQFAFLLLATVVNRNCSRYGVELLSSALDPRFAKLMRWSDATDKNAQDVSSDLPLLDVLQRSDNIVMFHNTLAGTSFKQRAMSHEAKTGERLSAAELLEVQERVVSRLAARGLNAELSQADFDMHLADVRRQHE